EVETFTVVSSQQIRVKLKVAVDADTGVYDLKITNPDGNSLLLSGQVAVKTLVFSEKAYAYPCPVRNGQVTFTVIVSEASDIEIRVFDLLGNLMWEHSESLPVGKNSIGWDLMSLRGSRIGSGVYLYRITADSGRNIDKTVKKLVVIEGQ
ncbi:MAG TPA: T9SS type A sorting domain-containing protein, partial [bacterium]|nr:T9SS type A sorting domain-containing protein [bacterium]